MLHQCDVQFYTTQKLQIYLSIQQIGKNLSLTVNLGIFQYYIITNMISTLTEIFFPDIKSKNNTNYSK